MGNAEDRAHRDADELTEHFNRLVRTFVIPNTLVHAIRRRAAEQLVTWGWTRVGPGEQVVQARTERDTELTLVEQLAATIAGAGIGNGPVALAEYLVDDGWLKLESGQRVIGRTDAVLLNDVQCAYVRWEAFKKKVKENRAESAEVSADASELTSGVKPGSDEKRILAAFAAADRPLYFDEAAEAAAGHRVTTHAPETWDRWCTAFRSLYQRELIESLPAPEGEVRRYQLTLAGRDLHELDGVDG